MKSVLVAHALSHRMRRTTVDFVMSFGRYAPPGVDVTYHNIRKPTGRNINGRSFDAVIITYDLLSLRSAHEWDWIVEATLPLANASERVIAMPQDDYTYNAVLDQSLDELGTDTIYTPIETGLELVYPIMSRKASIRRALTGYVDEATSTKLDRFRVPMSERTIDVGQRVRMLSPWYGRSGMDKGLLAERFKEMADGTEIVTDISTDPADVFAGDEWYRFLGSCRATLGQKGGASLCDPDGSMRLKVLEYKAAHPTADFDEVEASCFPGLDGQAVMRAVSPRLFDAAMLHTVQILIEDDYLGVLEPWDHYIPTDRMLSNFDEVADVLQDVGQLEKMAKAAADLLIHSGDFTYRSFVTEVCNEITESGTYTPPTTVGVDTADEVQWRLSPDLFEALQRCIHIAWAAKEIASLVSLAERVERLLSEQPALAAYLDLELFRALSGPTDDSPRMATIIAPFIDIFTESFRLGASRAVIKWMRWISQSQVSVWQLRDWIDQPRIQLDSGVTQ